MDRLKSFEVFSKVADVGSFAAAARTLGISAPMATKHVQDLEIELGVRLFHRTTRRVSLTEAGHALNLRCKSFLAEIEEALTEAGHMQAEPRGLLRVNAPLTFGRAHLTRAIAEFQARYSEISIDLTLNDRTVDIVDEGFDLAIRIGLLDDSSLVSRKLAPCRMVLCASPEYLARSGTPERPEDLTKHNCLIYAYFKQAKRWNFACDGDEIAVNVEGDFRANFGEALVEAAAAGRGITLEPSFTVAPYLRDGRLVPLLPAFKPRELAIYAVYPPSRMLPQKVRAFIDHLATSFGAKPYWDDL